MAEVPGVLLDHVHEHLAQRDRALVDACPRRRGRRRRVDDLLGALRPRAARSPRRRPRPRVGDRAVEVEVAVLLGPVEPRQVELVPASPAGTSCARPSPGAGPARAATASTAAPTAAPSARRPAPRTSSPGSAGSAAGSPAAPPAHPPPAWPVSRGSSSGSTHMSGYLRSVTRHTLAVRPSARQPDIGSTLTGVVRRRSWPTPSCDLAAPVRHVPARRPGRQQVHYLDFGGPSGAPTGRLRRTGSVVRR